MSDLVPLTDAETDLVSGGVVQVNHSSITQTATAISVPPICFLRGTRIETDEGPVAIENLRIGDRVRTHSGRYEPIKWIGRMSYDRAPGASWRGDVEPVCVAESALSPGVPARDLYVSQRHALLLAGTLIMAKDLVNGLTITLSAPKGLSRLDYLHLEFERHEVVYAEGAAAESMKPSWEERQGFANLPEFECLYGRDDTAVTPYAPLSVDAGDSTQAQREGLAARTRFLRAGATAAVDHKAAA
jgi:hypothetical protein